MLEGKKVFQLESKFKKTKIKNKASLPLHKRTKTLRDLKIDVDPAQLLEAERIQENFAQKREQLRESNSESDDTSTTMRR